jgi:hypothetical protein
MGKTIVVHLDSYRAARRAREFMLGIFHDPPWLADLVVESDGNGGARLVVLLNWETVMILRCLPTSVSGVPMVARVIHGTSGAPGSG